MVLPVPLSPSKTVQWAGRPVPSERSKVCLSGPKQRTFLMERDKKYTGPSPEPRRLLPFVLAFFFRVCFEGTAVTSPEESRRNCAPFPSPLYQRAPSYPGAPRLIRPENASDRSITPRLRFGFGQMSRICAHSFGDYLTPTRRYCPPLLVPHFSRSQEQLQLVRRVTQVP